MLLPGQSYPRIPASSDCGFSLPELNEELPWGWQWGQLMHAEGGWNSDRPHGGVTRGAPAACSPTVTFSVPARGTQATRVFPGGLEETASMLHRVSDHGNNVKETSRTSV